MNTYVTVDVEGLVGAGESSMSEAYASVDLLDKQIRKLNIRFNVFVTPDVIVNRKKTVKEWMDNDTLVGLHVHPARSSKYPSDDMTDYGVGEIIDIVGSGAELFESVTATHPRYFRAGKWRYSNTLMKALSSLGFQADASLRPYYFTEPFYHCGVKEIPLSTYTNPLLSRALRTFWISPSLPLHVDVFSRNELYKYVFRGIVRRLVCSGKKRVVISYHDYDLLDPYVRRNIYNIVEFVDNYSSTCMLSKLV